MENKEETIQIGPRIPKSLKKELDLICVREGSDVQDIVKKCLEEYVKVHGEGNPVYALDKWVDSPKFKAVPALLENTDKWMTFLQNCDEQTKQDIHGQLFGLKRLMEQRGLI